MMKILKKLGKELGRAKKKLLLSSQQIREEERLMYRQRNAEYELYAKGLITNKPLQIPIVKSADETLDKILSDSASLIRFGDGEFSIMNGGGIHFQKPSESLAKSLHNALTSEQENILVALPDCFGSLDAYVPDVADFWRKWLVKKRPSIYNILDMSQTYYSAFFTRVYMPYHKTETHYQHCREYFDKVKQIWSGRNILVCEGEGTRFGMFNDLLREAKSISRILCPATNAYDKYEEILKSLQEIDKKTLILTALGPTATALVYDLACAGYQAIDIGHLDVEYEWFLRRDEEGLPLEHKYVDGSKEGRKVHQLDDAEYTAQIIKHIH